MNRSILVLAVTSLVAPLAAQTGTFTTYGSGCGVPGSCVTANANQTTLRGLTQNSNIFCISVPAQTSATVVFGFEFYTQRLQSTPLTFATQIYYADPAGKPTGNPVATGSMTVDTALAWYCTTFARPLIVPANQKFFLSYTSVQSSMRFPIMSAGTSQEHYWHPATATTWNGPFSTVAWGWKVTCGAPMVPTIANTGIPTIGRSFSIDLASAPGNANSLLAIGVGRTSIDLTVIGATGCSLYTNPLFVLGAQTSAAGARSQSLPIPNDTSLVNFKFNTQYGVNSGANPAGIIFTAGGEATVGR